MFVEIVPSHSENEPDYNMNQMNGIIRYHDIFILFKKGKAYRVQEKTEAFWVLQKK